MTDHQFETHQPVHLYVENGKGSVTVHAEDTTETRVALTGADADDAVVELDGEELRVIAPKRRGGFLGGERGLDIAITVPTSSELVAKLGSAGLSATGALGATQVRSGSGEVRLELLDGPCLVETGSGDLVVADAGQPLRVKSGSGEVTVGTTAQAVSISTGSGDVRIRYAGGPTVVKTGSGSLRIDRARTDVGLTTGSGDLEIASISAGRVQVRGASGDVRVGVPAGLPVWTDVSTVSGRIHSTLEGAGRPEDGADYVELRAKTVSGDIVLAQV